MKEREKIRNKCIYMVCVYKCMCVCVYIYERNEKFIFIIVLLLCVCVYMGICIYEATKLHKHMYVYDAARYKEIKKREA